MFQKYIVIKQLDEAYGTQNLEKAKFLFFLRNKELCVLPVFFRNEDAMSFDCGVENGIYSTS